MKMTLSRIKMQSICNQSKILKNFPGVSQFQIHIGMEIDRMFHTRINKKQLKIIENIEITPKKLWQHVRDRKTYTLCLYNPNIPIIIFSNIFLIFLIIMKILSNEELYFITLFNLLCLF